jgi:hypothetical protein
MATKKIKLTFQVNSNDGSSPVSCDISWAGAAAQTFSLPHTQAWTLDTDETDLPVATAELSITVHQNDTVPGRDTAAITIAPTGGDIYWVACQENYVADWTSPDDGVTWSKTDSTGADYDAPWNPPLDVVTDPTIDGAAYGADINFDWADYYVDGVKQTQGTSAFVINDGETFATTVQYSWYTS